MIVSSIVAVTKNGVIGKDNDIPWDLPKDMRYFKRTTLNHHIIMGRKNFEAMGNPLPKRTNIILTRDPFYIVSNSLVAHSIEEALSIAFDNGEEEAFIIGGGEIYKQSMPYWDKFYITEIDAEIEGDVYFPEVDYKEWELVSEEQHRKDENNPYDFIFKVYERKAAE
ncbi:dihydrofolate reductase [Portibacter marinus]|uniref:dihydrofolate reductase n=1 Tax=Portibacter marinus TaxID=2898660 RepID=UPI001F3EA222|nr:dihydrofolate reductase [Portibacter marinus]